MTAIEGCELATDAVKLTDEHRIEAPDELNCGDDEDRRSHARSPWIGALPNPRQGPLLVVNDGGNLVSLFTAVDLVRGCRSFWQGTRGWV